jgi:hypothetical protein
VILVIKPKVGDAVICVDKNMRGSREDNVKQGVITKIGSKYYTVLLTQEYTRKYCKTTLKSAENFGYPSILYFSIEDYRELEEKRDLIRKLRVFLNDSSAATSAFTLDQLRAVCRVARIDVEGADKGVQITFN